jgi:hypothetical protein
MVAKGVSLSEALRQAAAWETFVAPVKEEPAKLVQGRSFDGPGGGPPGGFKPAAKSEPEEDEEEEDGGDDDEPAADADE